MLVVWAVLAGLVYVEGVECVYRRLVLWAVGVTLLALALALLLALAVALLLRLAWGGSCCGGRGYRCLTYVFLCFHSTSPPTPLYALTSLN